MPLDVEALSDALSAQGIVLGNRLENRPFTVCFAGTRASGGTDLFVKALHAPEPKVRAHFAREIDILRSLSGRPGMPALYAASDQEPRLFHACARVPGPRLDLTFDAMGDSLADILRIAQMLAQRVGELHAAGIAHRDLSPDHVFLDQPDSITIVDFGMAKRTAGLPHEQRLLYEGYDIQTVGMIIWELICGRPLFDYRGRTLPAQLAAEVALIADTPLPKPVGDLISSCLRAKSEVMPIHYLDGDGQITSAEELLEKMMDLRS